MTTDNQTLNNTREIYFKSDGVLNGNTLSVATHVLWGDTKEPIKGLTISPIFNSGNGLPPGVIKVTNDYYDEVTGIYWFDIKVNPVSGPITYYLQSTGKVDGKTFPTRFDVSVMGESNLIVESIVFDGTVLDFKVTAKKGKLLRYPLNPVATRNIIELVKGNPVTTPSVSYGCETDIKNGESKTIAIMGVAEVDQKREHFIVRVNVKTNDGKVELLQKDNEHIDVKVTLKDTPKGEIKLDLPVYFLNEKSNTVGLSNKVFDYKVKGKVITFTLPITPIKKSDTLIVDFSFTETGNQSLPISFYNKLPVKILNGDQINPSISIGRHYYAKETEILELSINWENGKPVNDFNINVNEPDTKVIIKGNKITLHRNVKTDPFKANPLTFSGVIKFDNYGLDKTLDFSETITIGSDTLPIKVISGYSEIQKDTLVFKLAIRQNNGDIFKDAIVNDIKESPDFNNVITYQHYDKETGILSLMVDNTKTREKPDKTYVQANINVTSDKEETGKIAGFIGMSKQRSVTASTPTWGFKLNQDTGLPIMTVAWIILDERGKHPSLVYGNKIVVNGDKLNIESRYNSTFGRLSIDINTAFDHNQKVHIEGWGISPGLPDFINLPPVDIIYKKPGSVVYSNHEFTKVNGQDKVIVNFDVFGWKATPPNEVILNDLGWLHLNGVKLGKTYSEYNNKTGILSITFDIFDINAETFSGDNTIQLGKSDPVIYPIEFIFSK